MPWMTGRRILCNRPYSGTQVIQDYGREQMETGGLIVYTSADSVFQIAAHESIIPPEQLYGYCQTARELLQGKHGVGRVIAVRSPVFIPTFSVLPTDTTSPSPLRGRHCWMPCLTMNSETVGVGKHMTFLLGGA